MDGRSRKLPVDHSHGPGHAVGGNAVRPVAVGDVVRAVVARGRHGVVPLQGELVTAGPGTWWPAAGSSALVVFNHIIVTPYESR